jgi:Flp pilus assembly protein TadB
MAQAKKKRRSKHRGNAAGIVEARGRTGRKPTPEEAKRNDREQARRERMMRPPNWRSATNRAALAAVVFGVVLVIGFGQKVGPAIALTAFVFVLYIPLGYYTDSFLYKRRLRTELKAREKHSS